MRQWLPFVFGAFLACGSTSSDHFLVALARGQRAGHSGRHNEAAAAYENAAKVADRIKDRDEAMFLAARSYERAGEKARARQTYEALIQQSPEGPRTVTAQFALIELSLEEGSTSAWDDLYALVKKHQRHGISRPSLDRYVAHRKERHGAEATIEWLLVAATEFDETDLKQGVLYTRARLLEELDRKSEARDAYLRAAREFPYPRGGLTDDAFTNAAKLEEELGRYEEAIALLRELLSAREAAAHMGSYERPRYSQAQYHIAEIYRDRLGNKPKAREEFHRLVTDHKTSVLRDDALWNEALLAHEARDAIATCSLLNELQRDFPESRYSGCAAVLCPSLGRSKQACADYILESLSAKHP